MQKKYILHSEKEDTMLNRIEQYINKNHMISADDVVIAGVSGGADSMCLLFVLEELRKKLGFRFIVVHVNHCIRVKAADEDEAYVRKVCEEKNIVCEVFREDVKGYAKEMKLSEEEAGRNIRRQCYEKAVRKYGGTRIALAHHQEDNAETFFLHLARGSKLKGLAGIYPVKGMYIRPLLCVSRGQIENFLEERNIPYCTDATNTDEVYLRNRVRKNVIPYFREEINPKAVEHINSTMDYLRQVEDFLEKYADSAYLKCSRKTEKGIMLSGEELEKCEPLIVGMIIRKALTETAGREKDIEEIHVDTVRNLLNRQTGRKVDLPYGMKAEKSYGQIHIFVEKNVQKPEQKEWILTPVMGKMMVYDCDGLEISCRLFKKPAGDILAPKKTYTKWFDYDIIKDNVTVRTRRTGDRIVIDEKGNSQKLKSFFINEKIPSEERDHIPLFADGQQILWVAGHRQSKGYQITDHTVNILEITINGGN